MNFFRIFNLLIVLFSMFLSGETDFKSFSKSIERLSHLMEEDVEFVHNCLNYPQEVKEKFSVAFENEVKTLLSISSVPTMSTIREAKNFLEVILHTMNDYERQVFCTLAWRHCTDNPFTIEEIRAGSVSRAVFIQHVGMKQEEIELNEKINDLPLFRCTVLREQHFNFFLTIFVKSNDCLLFFLFKTDDNSTIPENIKLFAFTSTYFSENE